jgi:hypothetical protein
MSSLHHCVLAAILFPLTAFAQTPPKLAAPGLTGVGFDAAFTGFVSEQLAQELRDVGLEVVTAKEVGAVLGFERQKQLLECGDTGVCLTELANALGADAVLVGELAQVGKKIQVNVRVVSARDARVLGSSSERVAGREAVLDALGRAAKKIGPSVARALGKPLLATSATLPPVSTVSPQVRPAATADNTGAPDAGPCGGEWCEVDRGERRTESGGFELNHVWANSPSDVWAVGYGATVLRWDGKQWKQKNAPGERNGVLNVVWGSGPANVFVAGQNGLFYRWNGTGWQAMHDEKHASIHAVHGLPDGGSVWAASDRGLLRFDGQAFGQSWDGGQMRSVVSVAADEAWAGGKGRVLHWNGKSWSDVDAGVPAQTALFSAWASGPEDVWFAGSDGMILRYRGKLGFSQQSAGSTSLLGGWALSPNDAWACGVGGALLHWDGSAWTAVSGPSGATILGCAGAGASDLWFIQNGGQQAGAAVHFRR